MKFNNSTIVLFLCLQFSLNAMGQGIVEKANSQSNSFNFNCTSCNVSNPNNAVDVDEESFSTLNINAGIAGAFIEQTLIFPSGACAFDTVWIILENTKIASDSNLVGVNLTSFNGTISNNDKQVINSRTVLPNGRTRVAFIPKFNYDRVSVSLNVSLLDAVTNLRIYFALKKTLRPQFKGLKLICQNSRIDLKAYIPELPNAIFSWYESPSGGSALFSGDSSKTFTSPIINANKIFYVERCATNNSLRTPISVQIIPLPTLPVVSGDLDLCKGQSTSLTATGSKGNEFKWYSDSLGVNAVFVGKIFNTGPLYSNKNYFVESVTLPDSCRSLGKTKVSIKVAATDNIPTAANPDSICAGEYAVLRALSPAGADFSWFENQIGGSPIATGISYSTPALTESKSYWLESFLSNCGESPARTEVKVLVKARPETPLANDIVKVCKGSDLAIAGSSNTIGAKLSWWDSPTAGTKIHIGDTLKLKKVETNFSIYLQADLNGCGSSLRKRIDIQLLPIPSKPELRGLQQVCKGNPSFLTAYSDYPNANFFWLDKNNNLVNTGDKFLTPILVDSISYKCYVEVDGCISGISSIHIDISKQLSAPILNCGPKTATSVSVVWDSVPGAMGYLVSVGGSDFVLPNGNYIHTIYNLKPNDTASVRILSVGLPPCDSSEPSERFVCRSLSCGSEYFTKFGEQKVCKGDFLTLTAKGITSNNYSISWNGSKVDTLPTYTFKPEKDQLVSFEILDRNQALGCPYQQEMIPIKVNEKPNIVIRAKPEKVIIPNPVQFFDETAGDETYYWDFGDGTFSTERNPIKVYDQPGKYDVKLIVKNTFGCEDSILKKDFVDADFSPLITMPNSFSPNGDGLNDRILPELRRINTYQFKIFDKKGVLLYSERDPIDGWDGKSMSADQPAGAYFFIVEALGSDSEKFVVKGFINIIR